MYYLEMKTIGEVAFSTGMKLEEGYRYDIPFDNLMLPYIPLASFFEQENLGDRGVKIGLAHPQGYRGLSMYANELLKNRPDLSGFMKRYFTMDRFYAEEGIRIRSIKSGMRFAAILTIPEGMEEEIGRKLSGRRQIGITAQSITGEVEFCVQETDRFSSGKTEYSHGRRIAALDYSAMLVTPACFYAPYEEGDKTYPYIPGAVVSDLIEKSLPELCDQIEKLRCSNAYISKNKKRLLPVPICVSVVKLDKNEMRYRLSPGKDPNRIEQDVGLKDCFAEEFESSYMPYVKPETEHIVSHDGARYDALTTGQTFCGTIYGSDAVLRKVAAFMTENPYVFAGKLAEEGYGELFLRVEEMREKEIPAEVLAEVFDVSCVADVLLLNDDGMPSCKGEDLLREIEYLLDCPGKLRIEGRYTDIYRDYSENLRWGSDQPVVRCLAKGSVLRLRTVDGKPVNIFPLLHCFVGERTENGYGEMITYPARNQYYRRAEKLESARYERNFRLSIQEMEIGASYTKGILSDLLRSRVRALAVTDRMDGHKEETGIDDVVLELLRAMREQFDPSIPEEDLIRWYESAKEEERKKHAGDSI